MKAGKVNERVFKFISSTDDSLYYTFTKNKKFWETVDEKKYEEFYECGVVVVYQSIKNPEESGIDNGCQYFYNLSVYHRNLVFLKDFKVRLVEKLEEAGYETRNLYSSIEEFPDLGKVYLDRLRIGYFDHR